VSIWPGIASDCERRRIGPSAAEKIGATDLSIRHGDSLLDESVDLAGESVDLAGLARGAAAGARLNIWFAILLIDWSEAVLTAMVVRPRLGVALVLLQGALLAVVAHDTAGGGHIVAGIEQPAAGGQLLRSRVCVLGEPGEIVAELGSKRVTGDSHHGSTGDNGSAQE
jgi:hypothetical protein